FLKNRGWSPSEPPSELVTCLSLSVAAARKDRMLVAFCRFSEGLSEVPSLSFAVFRPASLTG
ncbi:hypothetical protein A2U01_0101234, partial [Trifolium medium]|nr:hypothetical protein [Trifolium medium]